MGTWPTETQEQRVHSHRVDTEEYGANQESTNHHNHYWDQVVVQLMVVNVAIEVKVRDGTHT